MAAKDDVKEVEDHLSKRIGWRLASPGDRRPRGTDTCWAPPSCRAQTRKRSSATQNTQNICLQPNWLSF